MSGLSDLQICKRIAEIEGFDHFGLTDQGYMAFNKGINHSVTDRTFFNPFMDDALCFRLMVKYEVTFEPSMFFVGRYSCYCRDEHQNKILPKIDDKSPSKAICLAIIEAHKEINND